jgi:hypothetical protein
LEKENRKNKINKRIKIEKQLKIDKIRIEKNKT